MATLLQIAKGKTPLKVTKYKVTNEHIELVKAWLKDEVNLTQVSRALGNKKHGVEYSYILAIIKAM